MEPTGAKTRPHHRLVQIVSFLGVICFLLLRPPHLAAQDGAVMLDEGRLWAFAEDLLRRGEYYRAVTEYKRLLHFFPDGKQRQPARLRVGEALLLGGEAARAANHFEAALRDGWMAPRADDIRYLLALSRLETGPRRPYPLREGEIGRALADLRSISEAWPGQARVAGFVGALSGPPELPQKSPWLAGGLSAVLPGTGSFYVGRYAEGSLALFVNALLFYGTTDALARQRDGLATVLGSLALAFYGGSIYAAANGAHKFNGRARAAYLNQQRIRFGIVVERGGLAGVFRKRF